MYGDGHEIQTFLEQYQTSLHCEYKYQSKLLKQDGSLKHTFPHLRSLTAGLSSDVLDFLHSSQCS